MTKKFIRWKATIIWSLLLSNISCNPHVEPSAELRELSGATLSLPEGCRESGGLRTRILFYVDAEGCTSCRLRATLQWYTQNRHELLSMDSCSVIVVLAPTTAEQRSVATVFCEMYDKPDVMVWDSAMVFVRSNPAVPDNSDYHTFLLDRDNRVVLVGSPVGNPKMWELYKSTIARLGAGEGIMPGEKPER